LRDHPGNTIGVLLSRVETLALALIKRPGSGKVWRSSVRSQSKHKRACQAKSKKQLSHSRSPSVVWIITEIVESTKTINEKL
jgi:ribosomal protein L24E